MLYDGQCQLCLNAVSRFGATLRRHHFDLAPLQTPWVRQRLGLRPDQPLTEMKLLAADGRIFGGADALAQIARRIWWAWPLFAASRIPGVMFIFRAIYRRLAAKRHCIGGG